MFEILHFRDSDKILKEKRLLKDVQVTMEYIDDVLAGSLYKRELLRMALMEMDWTNDADIMRILQGIMTICWWSVLDMWMLSKGRIEDRVELAGIYGDVVEKKRTAGRFL